MGLPQVLLHLYRLLALPMAVPLPSLSATQAPPHPSRALQELAPYPFLPRQVVEARHRQVSR